MKTINSAALILLTITLYCCNPSAGLKDVTEAVKLNAVISDTNETIPLGDTLKISLKLPDTVITNLRTCGVQSLQRGFYALHINKVDTTNRRSILLLPPLFWLSKGTIEGNLFFVMNRAAKPYEVIINFKPKEKGLYYLEVVPQAGDLQVNNEIRMYLFVNFAVSNKHYNILNIIAPYFGGQAFYDAGLQREIDGFGTYFFRVI